MEQVVKSALGNAEDRGAHDIEDLIVLVSRVDGGPIMKRIMPRARGTAYPIKRRYAHIHVTLSDGEQEVAAAEAAGGSEVVSVLASRERQRPETNCEQPDRKASELCGQKVRPTGFRTGIFVDWLSTWYANTQDFSDLLVEDFKIRKFVKQKYGGAQISKIRIQRTREKVVVYVHSGRVGMIIGKKGTEVDKPHQGLGRFDPSSH